MARSRQVTIEFLGDSKGLINAANSAGRSTTTLGDKLKRVGKAAMIGFAGAAVVAGKAAWDFAEAAVEDEKSAALMAKQLRNSTGATRDQVAAVEDWISKQGELLGVTDDELRPAIARLAGATGDISEAEKLASLAMDVSKGKGKDLKTVYEALAKGVDGNVGAIGRLGVKTKDAEGKTKSLTEITDDLAKLYGGSAAKAADTAAGKFERTKVALSETAESLGYKLLPYVTDFSDWLVNDGVPGLEDFAHSAKREVGPVLEDLADWVSENKDEFADLAQEIASNALPIIRNVGGVAGDAVAFFNKLPAPVKQFGAEAAIAAAIMPKLSSALGAIKFQEFISNVGTAETRTKALQSAAKAAAGGAGLALLIDSTQRSNDGLGALESTVGGAAAGFAVGGPWGAAIGGAAGLIAKIATSSNEARDSAEKAYREIGKVDPLEEAADANKALKDSLDQVTGAYTGATRAAVLKTLQENGSLETAAKYGITARQAVDAALGQKGALKALTPVIADYGDQIADLDAKQQAIKDSSESYQLVSRGGGKYVKQMTTAALEQLTALEKQKKGLQETREQLQRMPGDLRADAKELRANSAATTDYTGKLKGLPKQVKTAILQTGIEPTTRAIADLTKKYNLTPKQVKTLIQASGADTSKRAVQNLIDTMNRLHDKTVTITTHHNDTYGGQAGGGGHSVGTGEKSAGRQGRVGNVVDLAAVMGGRGNSAYQNAGTGLIVSFAQGLKKGERTVRNVLDKLQDYVQTKADALQGLLDDRSGFIASFRDAFSESIFSAQFSDAEGNALPPTIQRLLDFATGKRDNAKNLAANVGTLLNNGLSKDLIDQLVSQGQAGYDQIAALAQGSAAQIQQFNNLNAETKTTLEGLGLDIYNKLNPGVQGQIDLLTEQRDQGKAQIDLLQQLLAAALANGKQEVRIQGSDIILAVKGEEKKKGKRYWQDAD